MNMGNLNKLALTAQEALQQTLSIASDAQASPGGPIHMLRRLCSNPRRTTCRRSSSASGPIPPPCARASTPIIGMPKVSGSGNAFGMTASPARR